MIIASVVARIATEGRLHELKSAQAAVLVVTLFGFFWGMAYFPVPRPREI